MTTISVPKFDYKEFDYNPYKRGDIISCEFINLIQDVNVYKLLFVTQLEERYEPQSATLYIPQTITNTSIISFKRATLTEIAIETSIIGYLNYAPTNIIKTILPDFEMSRKSGCVLIVADGKGYGVSPGHTQYLNYVCETFCQVDAMCAFRQLYLQSSIIEYDYDVMNIIQIGYSLGGMFSLGVANELQKITKSFQTVKFNIHKIICGGVFNVSNLIQPIVKG